MNRTIHLLLLAMLLFSSSVFADAKLELRHRLTSFVETANGSELSFTLRLRNVGTESLNNIKLVPSDALVSESGATVLHTGSLGVGNEVQVQWTVSSPADMAYLRINLPLLFQVEAVKQGGDSIAFPLYSIGESTP